MHCKDCKKPVHIESVTCPDCTDNENTRMSTQYDDMVKKLANSHARETALERRVFDAENEAKRWRTAAFGMQLRTEL